MEKSCECPQCRKKVTEVKKNSTLNNLIEKFLEKHPEQKRSKEELDELESKNKITTDVVKVNTKMFPGLFTGSFPIIPPLSTSSFNNPTLFNQNSFNPPSFNRFGFGNNNFLFANPIQPLPQLLPSPSIPFYHNRTLRIN